VRKSFFTVAKTGRADDPVIKTLNLPCGTQAKIMRRDVYERALLAANEKLREIRGKDLNTPNQD
jgi:hypothetical protein